MRYIILLILLLRQLLSQEYTLGEGVKLFDTPIYLGGYTTMDYLHRSDDYNRFRLDEVALLGYGHYKRFSFMSELLYKESYVKEWGKVEDEKVGTPLTIERLYLDYRVNDALTLRAGKFNTPVGYWNLEPINVLRDSASNPYLAYIIYPRYTTGVLLTYADTFYSNASYTLIAQNNNDLDDAYNNISVKKHYALGYEYTFENSLQLKINGGYFQTTKKEESKYALASLEYDVSSYKINAAFGLRQGDKGKWSVPYAFYLQGVYRLSEEHNFIGRYESYEIDEGAMRKEQIAIFGYTYRPLYPIALKVEYQAHEYRNENQLHLAFSVMF